MSLNLRTDRLRGVVLALPLIIASLLLVGCGDDAANAPDPATTGTPAATGAAGGEGIDPERLMEGRPD